jgi:Na+-driven multidrug efflux pump
MVTLALLLAIMLVYGFVIVVFRRRLVSYFINQLNRFQGPYFGSGTARVAEGLYVVIGICMILVSVGLTLMLFITSFR